MNKRQDLRFKKLNKPTKHFLLTGETDDGRNNTVFRVACEMIPNGFDDDEIYGAVSDHVLAPDFDADELRAIIKSAASKPRKPSKKRHHIRAEGQSSKKKNSCVPAHILYIWGDPPFLPANTEQERWDQKIEKQFTKSHWKRKAEQNGRSVKEELKHAKKEEEAYFKKCSRNLEESGSYRELAKALDETRVSGVHNLLPMDEYLRVFGLDPDTGCLVKRRLIGRRKDRYYWMGCEPLGPMRDFIGKLHRLRNAGHESWWGVFDASPRPDLHTVDPGDIPQWASRIIFGRFFDQLSQRLRLIYWRDTWLQWQDSGPYQVVPEREIKREVREFLSVAKYADKDGNPTRPVHATNPNVNSVLDAMKEMLMISSDRQPGQSIHSPIRGVRDDLDDSTHLLPLANGVLNTKTGHFAEGFDSHRLIIGTSTVEYDKDAPEPKVFIDWLYDIFDGDEKEIERLREIGHYIICGGNALQKIPVFVGPKRSGKTTMERILSMIVGEHRVTNPPTNLLGNDHGLATLVGKHIAFLSDMRLDPRNSRMVIELMLSISGGSPRTINEKYKAPYEAIIEATLVVISNELPEFRDDTGTIASRLEPVHFKRSAYGREDPKLFQKLKEERSGIVNWFMEAAGDYEKFQETDSSLEFKKRLTHLSSSVLEFIEEKVVVTGNESDVVAKSTVYSRYETWCEAQNVKPLAANRFHGIFKDCTKATEIRGTHPKTGKRRRYFVGVRVSK